MDQPLNGDSGGLYTSKALCDLAGITYRQCDYWTTNGWLHPAAVERNRLPANGTWQATPHNPGSGWSRHYPPIEVSVAWAMRYLIESAHLSVVRAALTARGYVEDGETEHRLCDGVVLVLTIPLPSVPEPPGGG